MRTYYNRIADDILSYKLSTCGAVLIKEPKWCGKSTTAEQKAKSVVYMQDTSQKNQNMELAKNAPALLLEGEIPRLIDEWQVIPFICDQIRSELKLIIVRI